MHRGLVKLVALARREGVRLRQSYLRVAKRAAIMVGRYSHAHQFKRAGKALKAGVAIDATGRPVRASRAASYAGIWVTTV